MESQTRSQVIRAALLSIAVGGGAFAGMWGWDAFKAWRTSREEAERVAAIEAEKKTPRGIQREVVRQFMVDPDSAEFRNDVPARRTQHFWCGEINAKNRMGARVGFTRYVAFVHADRTQDHLDEVTMDVVDPIGDRDKARAASFRGKWSVHCE